MGKEPSAAKDIIKNTGKLFSANLFVQIIVFAAYPLLSRLFSPTDFGVLALFLGIGDIVARLGTLSLEEAILLPKKDKEASFIAGLSIYSLFIVSLVSFLFFVVNQYVVTCYEFSNYFLLLPIYIFLTGLVQIYNFFFNRDRLYRDISISIAGMGLSNTCFRVLGGLLRFSYPALLLSSIFSQGVALSVYFMKVAKQKLGSVVLFPSRKEAVKLLLNYRQFPAYVMTRNFLNSLSGNLPYFMLIDYFGASKVGCYSMAFTMAFKPVSLFSNSIYQVLFEKFSTLKKSGLPLRKVFVSYLVIVFSLALPLFLLAGYFSEMIFNLFLGPGWEEVGHYFRILLPWIFMVLLSTPLASIPLIFSQQKYAFGIDLVYLCLRVGALACGIFFRNIELALFLFAMAGVVIMGVLLFWYYLLIKKYDKSLS